MDRCEQKRSCCVCLIIVVVSIRENLQSRLWILLVLFVRAVMFGVLRELVLVGLTVGQGFRSCFSTSVAEQLPLCLARHLKRGQAGGAAGEKAKRLLPWVVYSHVSKSSWDWKYPTSCFLL